jgi:hypothetical protein
MLHCTSTRSSVCYSVVEPEPQGAGGGIGYTEVSAPGTHKAYDGAGAGSGAETLNVGAGAGAGAETNSFGSATLVCYYLVRQPFCSNTKLLRHTEMRNIKLNQKTHFLPSFQLYSKLSTYSDQILF